MSEQNGGHLAPRSEFITARLHVNRALVESSYGLDEGKWFVLCDAIFPSAQSADAILLALDYCKARGYDIFRRAVHIVPMWNAKLGKEVETVWPGVNSLQTDAARTGAFAGIDQAVWGPDVTKDLVHAKNPTVAEVESRKITFPEWCEVTVYRLVQGQRYGFSTPVFWEETYSSKRDGAPNEMWQKRKRGQLYKCALAASLRLAFPEAADYSSEEMEGKEIKGGESYAIKDGVTLQEPKKEPAKAPEKAAEPAGKVHDVAEDGSTSPAQDDPTSKPAEAEAPKRGRGRPPKAAQQAEPVPKQDPQDAPPTEEEIEAAKAAQARVAAQDAERAAAKAKPAEEPAPETTGPHQPPAIVFIGAGNKQYPLKTIKEWRDQWLARVAACKAAGGEKMEALERLSDTNGDTMMALYESYPADVDAVTASLGAAVPSFQEWWDAQWADGNAEDAGAPPM